MVVGNKQYRLRILDKAGNFLGSPPEFNIQGFRKIINGGQGDLKIDLPWTFDQGYTSPLTVNFNRTELYCIDGDTDRNGVLVHSGYINEVNPHFDGSTQGVTIVSRGHAARFSTIMLYDAAGQYVTLVTKSPAGLQDASSSPAASTIEGAVKTMIDEYQLNDPYPIINYSGSSLATTGVSFTYTFPSMFTADAINAAMQSAPPGAYWYCNAANLFTLALIGTSADYTLAFGRQFNNWDDHIVMDGMVNHELVAYPEAATSQVLFTDSTSSAQYGAWWETDNINYTDNGDATTYAKAVINSSNTPIRRLTVIVPDNNSPNSNYTNYGYDIESLEPGKLVQTTNLPGGVQQAIPDLLQIQAVDYSPESATLELVKLSDDLARSFAQNLAAQQTSASSGNPTTYGIGTYP
jgi:hypothetical protein